MTTVNDADVPRSDSPASRRVEALLFGEPPAAVARVAEQRSRSRVARSVALFVVGILVALGCGNSHVEPAPADAGGTEPSGVSQTVADVAQQAMPPFLLDEPSAFYRLDLKRSTDGQLSLLEVSRVESILAPMGTLNANYIAIAYSGAQATAAAMLSFPTIALGTKRVDGEQVHFTRSVDESSTSVFLQAAVRADHVSISDLEGVEVLSVPLPAAEEFELRAPDDKAAPIADPDNLGASQFGINAERLTVSDLASQYPHIRFLGAGQDNLVNSGLLAGGTLQSLSAEAAGVIASGLAATGPALLASVQMIAVVQWPKGGDVDEETFGMALGSQLVLSAEHIAEPEMPGAIAHETAHTFTFLTDAAATSQLKLGAWPAIVIEAAERLATDFRLVAGLSQVWRALHESGFSGGYTRPFVGPRAPFEAEECVGWEDTSPGDARLYGFASPYGACSEWEDLAEYVRSVQVPARPTQQGGICPLFLASTEVLPENAIPYAKLTLLLGIGAITQQMYTECVRNTALPLTPGIVFPGKITFDADLKAGRMNRAEGPSFGVIGSGPKSYRLLLEVALETSDTTPLGLHRLDNVWARTLGGAGLSGAYLTNDNPLLARGGEQGLVLFTEANATRTAGAFFGLVLQNGDGVDTDAIPFGTFLVE